MCQISIIQSYLTCREHCSYHVTIFVWSASIKSIFGTFFYKDPFFPSGKHSDDLVLSFFVAPADV